MKQHLYGRKRKGIAHFRQPTCSQHNKFSLLNSQSEQNLQHLIAIKEVQKCDTVYKYTVYSM